MAWTHEHAEILTAVVVTAAAFLHLLRNLSGWILQVGPYTVPQWISWIAVIVAGYLAYHFWRKILG